MITIVNDDVLKDPDSYVNEIFSNGFFDIYDGDKVFKNIQPRDTDEFFNYVLTIFPNYKVTSVSYTHLTLPTKA